MEFVILGLFDKKESQLVSPPGFEPRLPASEAGTLSN